MIQHEVAQYMDVYPNLPNEIECGKASNTIYVLHKVYLFLGYIPITLKIDKNSLRGKLFVHRIRYGYTYNVIAQKIGLDKSTISRFEKEKVCKKETLIKITEYFNKY